MMWLGEKFTYNIHTDGGLFKQIKHLNAATIENSGEIHNNVIFAGEGLMRRLNEWMRIAERDFAFHTRRSFNTSFGTFTLTENNELA